MIHEAVRLVAALDGLIAAESIALRHADLRAAADVQRRATPLIAALADASRRGSIPAALIPRLRSITERRQQNQVSLAGLKALRRTRLGQVEALRRRLAGLKPAYARRRARSTFVAAG